MGQNGWLLMVVGDGDEVMEVVVECGQHIGECMRWGPVVVMVPG